MTRASKIIIAMSVASTLFVGVVLLSLQPVPLPTSENTVLVEGLITSVEANEQTHDLIFEIEGQRDTYHVNRGLETDLRAVNIDDLVNKEISLYYVRTSNVFEAISGTHHVSKIQMEDQVLFDEIDIYTSIDLAAN